MIRARLPAPGRPLRPRQRRPHVSRCQTTRWPPLHLIRKASDSSHLCVSGKIGDSHERYLSYAHGQSSAASCRSMRGTGARDGGSGKPRAEDLEGSDETESVTASDRKRYSSYLLNWIYER